MAFINSSDNKWPDHVAVNSESTEWVKAYATLSVPATSAFRVEIHSWVQSGNNSIFQIKDFAIMELAPNKTRDEWRKHNSR